MLTFLKILFFGEWFVLTSGPVELSQTPTVISPDEPLTAVTGGAHIRINVLDFARDHNLTDDLGAVGQFFPEGCLRGAIISSDGARIPMEDSGVSRANDDVEMQLFASSGGVDTEREYSSLEVTSCVTFTSARITWANFYN